jgi:hypothetical protein
MSNFLAVNRRHFPADDAPGAKQAGVLYYIDQQLAGPLHRFGPAYHEGAGADSRSLSETDWPASPGSPLPGADEIPTGDGNGTYRRTEFVLENGDRPCDAGFLRQPAARRALPDCRISSNFALVLKKIGEGRQSGISQVLRWVRLYAGR